MDSEQMWATNDALKILLKARQMVAPYSPDSNPVAWEMLYHACQKLEKQITGYFRPERFE